jgi:hypothetical protein
LRKADLGTQEFRQSKLIRQSRKPYKFSGFSVLSVDKKKILIADQWKKSTAFFRITAKKSFCFNKETEVFATSDTTLIPQGNRQCPSQESEAFAAAVGTPTAESATLTAVFDGFCFVDGQHATVVLFAVHGFNCGLCLVVISHFDKAESFAATSITIRNHACAGNLTKLRKQRFQFRIRYRVAQIPDVQFLAHFFLQTENSGFLLLLSEADCWKEVYMAT